ncbi:MAG: DUF3418 domain-containing protein [Nocardioides sp.]
MEHRARRRDLVDEHTLFDFYDARVGADVVSGAHFDQWWKGERQRRPDLLTFDPAMLTHEGADEVREDDFPTSWADSGLTFPISYHFEPGAADDGLTIEVPVATLNRVDADDFSWLVPGLRQELVVALIRSLPKQLRVSFVPAPNTARAFLAAVPPGEEPLLTALERHLRATTGVVVPREAWDWSRVPDHLAPTFRVVDDGGREAGRGKDLDALKAPLSADFAQAVAEVAADSGLSATGQSTWTFGTLPETLVQARAGHEVLVHPALHDEGATVGLAVYGSPAEAEAQHRLGLRRLLLLDLAGGDVRGGPVKAVADGLDSAAKLGLAGSPYPSVAELLADVRAGLVLDVVDGLPPVRDPDAYAAALAGCRQDEPERLEEAVGQVLAVLAAWRAADKALSGRAELVELAARADMTAQLARLVRRGFVGEAGVGRLRHYPRYLAALSARRERLARDPAGDRPLMDRVDDLQQAWLHQVEALAGRPETAALRRVRWLLEELRVSLWAQQLGTAEPVSDQRIRKVLAG